MKGILVLTRTFGDVMIANVVIKNIKLQYPGIELDYVVEQRYVELVSKNPLINKVIPLEQTDNDWDSVLRMITSGYDKVFMAQQVCREDNWWHQVDKYRYRNLLDFYARKCHIEIKDRDLVWYQDEGVTPPVEIKTTKNVFCHTTTLGRPKNWPSFKELGKSLQERGFSVYQVGLNTDVSMNLKQEFDLRSKMTVQELVKVMNTKETVCFVGLDSGLSFVAAAAGLKVICIMGASVPRTSGPYGENILNILSKTRPECVGRRCHALFSKCKYGKACIDTIEVETVLAAFNGVGVA